MGLHPHTCPIEIRSTHVTSFAQHLLSRRRLVITELRHIGTQLRTAASRDHLHIPFVLELVGAHTLCFLRSISIFLRFQALVLLLKMGKKRILISYGVDVDAVAGWLGSYGGEDSTSDISRGM